MVASEVYSQRVRRAQELLAANSIDLLILTSSVDMFYLTGFTDEQRERLMFLMVPRAPREPVFVLPALYETEARTRTQVKDIRVWRDGQDPFAPVLETLGSLGRPEPVVAIDEVMFARFLLPLVKRGRAEWTSAAPVMVALRLTKDAQEVATMKEVGRLTDEVMARAVAACAPGVEETTVARLIQRAFGELGAEPTAGLPIVAAGPNGAMPHYRAGNRRMQRGDLVVLDFCGSVDGYWSDITRTICVGEASEEARGVYKLVEEAHRAGVARCVAGETCQAVDAAARGVIAAGGYGPAFVHRTGHGLGLEIHEEPQIVGVNPQRLEAGMVFSVEPGIYLPGRFGARVEDCVVVNADGPATELTSFRHGDLLIV
ncbi:MAG: M24 family metallopeptidase [Bacillota bacterium]